MGKYIKVLSAEFYDIKKLEEDKATIPNYENKVKECKDDLVAAENLTVKEGLTQDDIDEGIKIAKFNLLQAQLNLKAQDYIKEKANSNGNIEAIFDVTNASETWELSLKLGAVKEFYKNCVDTKLIGKEGKAILIGRKSSKIEVYKYNDDNGENRRIENVLVPTVIYDLYVLNEGGTSIKEKFIQTSNLAGYKVYLDSDNTEDKISLFNDSVDMNIKMENIVVKDSVVDEPEGKDKDKYEGQILMDKLLSIQNRFLISKDIYWSDTEKHIADIEYLPIPQEYIDNTELMANIGTGDLQRNNVAKYLLEQLNTKLAHMVENKNKCLSDMYNNAIGIETTNEIFIVRDQTTQERSYILRDYQDYVSTEKKIVNKILEVLSCLYTLDLNYNNGEYLTSKWDTAFSQKDESGDISYYDGFSLDKLTELTDENNAKSNTNTYCIDRIVSRTDTNSMEFGGANADGMAVELFNMDLMIEDVFTSGYTGLWNLDIEKEAVEENGNKIEKVISSVKFLIYACNLYDSGHNYDKYELRFKIIESNGEFDCSRLFLTKDGDGSKLIFRMWANISNGDKIVLTPLISTIGGNQYNTLRVSETRQPVCVPSEYKKVITINAKLDEKGETVKDRVNQTIIYQLNVIPSSGERKLEYFEKKSEQTAS